MAIDPNNFKQIQDVVAQQQGKSDGQVTGAAHAMQKHLQGKLAGHHKKKHKHKVDSKGLQAAIAKRLAASKK